MFFGFPLSFVWGLRFLKAASKVVLLVGGHGGGNTVIKTALKLNSTKTSALDLTLFQDASKTANKSPQISKGERAAVITKMAKADLDEFADQLKHDKRCE